MVDIFSQLIWLACHRTSRKEMPKTRFPYLMFSISLSFFMLCDLCCRSNFSWYSPPSFDCGAHAQANRTFNDMLNLHIFSIHFTRFAHFDCYEVDVPISVLIDLLSFQILMRFLPLFLFCQTSVFARLQTVEIIYLRSNVSQCLAMLRNFF